MDSLDVRRQFSKQCCFAECMSEHLQYQGLGKTCKWGYTMSQTSLGHKHNNCYILRLMYPTTSCFSKEKKCCNQYTGCLHLLLKLNSVQIQWLHDNDSRITFVFITFHLEGTSTTLRDWREFFCRHPQHCRPYYSYVSCRPSRISVYPCLCMLCILVYWVCFVYCTPQSAWMYNPAFGWQMPMNVILF